MKVMLVVTWIFGVGMQAPGTFQLQFDSPDLCNQAVETIRADVARLEKERTDVIEAARQGSKNADMGQMFAVMNVGRYAVSAVCLVTSAGP